MITLSDKTNGKIRELHGVDCAPYSSISGADQILINDIFGYAGIPRSRLHDCCGVYGGKYYVDIPNIFRDFDADENDTSSYDFYYTDEYIAAIIKTGAQIVYRLGVTIEHGTKKYTVNPPEDYDKWARICEHIIRHYNEGWANGYTYGIEYWEIWNEPENPPMWTGTREQFYELYKTASLHLSKCFPNIKIGGYGSCGFYAAVRENENQSLFQTFVPFFTEFLAFVKENGCPLDFFSWHIYSNKISELEGFIRFARKTLNEYGFENTESHCNEWNYGGENDGFKNMDTLVGASYCAAALVSMQKLGLDMAQYYCLSPQSLYNGFIYLRTKEYTPVIHVFAAFDKLFRACNASEISASENAPYCIAAKCGDKRFMLISNYAKPETTERIVVENGNNKFVKLYELKGAEGFELIAVKSAEKTVKFKCKENGVYFVVADENKFAANPFGNATNTKNSTQ